MNNDPTRPAPSGAADRRRQAARRGRAARSAAPPLPEDALIIVPVRNVVLFPGVVLPLSLGRPKSIAAAQEAARSQRPLGVLLQRDAEVDDPARRAAARGRHASPASCATSPRPTARITSSARASSASACSSSCPAIRSWSRASSGSRSRRPTRPEIEARLSSLKEQALEALQLLPQAPPELVNAVQAIDLASPAADLVASFMDLRPEEKQEILETDRRQRAARQGPASCSSTAIEVLQDLARHRRADQGGGRRPPARVHPARAAEGDPEGARRGARAPRAEIEELDEGDRRGRACPRRPSSRRARS